MSGIYHAAVEDDPLTSGNGSCVYSYKQYRTITGADGNRHRLAFSGDGAHCPRCDSTGLITYGSSPGTRHPLIDHVNGGRRQAVGGDIVLCKCADPPRIIAEYRRMVNRNRGEERAASIARTSARNFGQDKQFMLTDGERKALADTYYTVRTTTGELQPDVTGSFGRTTRYTTKDAQRLHVCIGRRE
ncbi:hypothetical protein SAMN05443245_5616 [Paraburkholderia fungorum]|uniref:PAAR domain-containing protein n=1 Tax=Paraburkholderia fungorum TaxID=134537 RepID=A0A1H1ISY7_9BURK|nr:hypothetical protein [Paraburkholderia fungorum]SDR40794.1 hypothetical protein SAMN05443245_5616 [Paraburkholderia fungorum]